MNPINNSLDGQIPAPTAVTPINKNKTVGTEEEKSFSDELTDKKTKERLLNKDENTISPQELRQQITESMVKRGIEKSFEKAREIGKDLKE